jgi:hypothetical protein
MAKRDRLSYVVALDAYEGAGMRNTPRVRGLVLAVLFVATFAAALYPVDEEVMPVVRQARAGVQPVAQALVQTPNVPHAADEEPAQEAANIDPFAPRDWQAPAPVAPAPANVAPLAVAPLVLEPQGPPPLPFQYMGRMTDGDTPLVYLVRGEQTLVAKLGETLDQAYRVVSIGPLQIDFLHIPTGEAQSMSLPAPDR